jgi:hypothetical protein
VYSAASAQLGEGGALVGDPSDALFSTGYTASDGPRPSVSSTTAVLGPQTFSLETWIRTLTPSGGKIIGFGNQQLISSTDYDRHIYMINSGQLVFGVHGTTPNVIITPGKYNDGNWHHLVATMGASGVHLYVDGVETAADPTFTTAENKTGYWKIGGDDFSGWPYDTELLSQNKSFTGAIDDVAVYGSELTPAQVSVHYAARQ